MTLRPEFIQNVGMEKAEEIQEKVNRLRDSAEVALNKNIAGLELHQVFLEVIAIVDGVPCVVRMPFDFYD